VAGVVLVAAVLMAGQAAFGRVTARPTTVRVQWGDNLWALARRYHVDLLQLAAANHMRQTDILYAGRTITLPGAAATVAKGTSTKAPAAADPRLIERTFCATYQPPGGRAALPASLRADPGRLALRPLFAKWARVYGVPLDLIEAEAWQESGWSNAVVSPDGAVGIGQLLPDTAVFVNQSLGTNLKLTVPSDNIRMMAAFLGYLLRATGGQVCGAVASYYQGLPTLQRYGVLPVSQIYVRNVLGLRPRFR
jgi:soluble lytic murein transglycosylase-like protein